VQSCCSRSTGISTSNGARAFAQRLSRAALPLFLKQLRERLRDETRLERLALAKPSVEDAAHDQPVDRAIAATCRSGAKIRAHGPVGGADSA